MITLVVVVAGALEVDRAVVANIDSVVVIA